MKAQTLFSLVAFSLLTFASFGCNSAPGRPKAEPEVPRPDEIHDFAVLYKQNCAACHGESGRQGIAASLANPEYLSLAGEDTLLRITAKGIPGTLMPPFAQSAGGMLTDQQVHDLVNGMISQWGKPDTLAGQTLPSYTATSTGDVQQGQQAFTTYCASCHGADGTGLKGKDAAAHTSRGSIVDPSYLALVSDQNLRTTTIVGLPGQGMPDWRGDVSSHAMTDKEVTDIVAWLASHRTQFPGQQYPAAAPTAQHQ
ncbi:MULTISPECIES: c-type cytochrome [Acidobacteriaceae]|uniref:c-type cytochrome n=1 Tax=Acidobacteriaceae TaxID=204434 RepID=UPI00131AFA04|nr:MULTISPECIES: cytochrome c [Acidobacteriaceae]MDW5264541.1 c-type cytochrome [Edaphobacter sp.]